MPEFFSFLVGVAVSYLFGVRRSSDRDRYGVLARALLGGFAGVYLGLIAVHLLEQNGFTQWNLLFLAVVCIAFGVSAQTSEHKQ